MTIRNRVAAAVQLLMLATCVFTAPFAHAQAASEPVIALAAEPEIVPVEPLAAALAAELGVAVTTREDARDVIPTVSVVRLASGNVEVSLASRSLPRASREIVLKGTVEEQSETVTLVAANLVRNEAASLLPDLRPAAPAPQVGSADVAVPPPLPPIDRCALKIDEPFAVDLAPGVGSSSSRSGRAATRAFSLGLFGTYSRALRGLELSIGVNLKRYSVCGAQLASGANIALGPVVGAQFANFNLAGEGLRGLQIGTVNVSGDAVRGAQLAVVNVAGGSVTGAQLGIANYGGELHGLQAGVANLDGGNLEGLQVGVVNLAFGGVQGAQIGVLNVSGGAAHGLQLGVANVAAGETSGLQLGVANVSAGAARGVQFGLVNYADSSRASIGILSIVRRGRTSLDVSSAVNTGATLFGITHGGRYIHNVLGVGIRDARGDEGARLALLYGIGVRAFSSERFRFDIDALSLQLLHEGAYDENTYVPQLRAAFTYMFFRGLGVMVAPSYQVMLTSDPQEITQSNWGQKVFHRGDLRVIGYPEVTLGLRFQFDHGV